MRLLCWTIVVLASLFTGIGLLNRARMGEPIPWAGAAWQIVGNLGFVLLVPAVVAVGRRWPLEPGRWLRRAAIHVSAAFLFSLAGTAIYVLARQAAKLVFGVPFNWERLVAGYLGGSLFLDLCLYVALAGALHGVLFYQRLAAREIRAARLETELAENRLRLLRAQLDPHFLFNTLHGMTSLIHDDPAAADQLVTRLSSFLRIVLEASRGDEVRLSDELEAVCLYVEIQRLRFADSDLRLAIDADDDALDAWVPTLMIQTLVENSIKHGRVPGRPLAIQVRAHRDDGSLHVSVRDDGAGFNAAPGASTGIGLDNTRLRLELLYGGGGAVELEPAPGGGAQARLRLPLRFEARNDADRSG